MTLRAALLASTVALAGFGATATAEPLTPIEYTDQAREIFAKSIAFDTVAGRGKTLAYAEYLKGVLVAGGFADADVTIEPLGDTATLVARYRGTGEKGAILLSAHMDVVEAIPSDWERDPFTLIEEDGFFFGRGTSDNKFGIVAMVTTLVRLKAEGFEPNRDIVLVLSGDEETTMASTKVLSTQFPDADLVLNADAGGGLLDEDGSGRAINYNLQAAEKTYADFLFAFTNPGGHSSLPRKDNAIYDLARALERLSAFAFPAQASELTREYFRITGPKVGGELGAAMIAFADDPSDTAAADRISEAPEFVGLVRTTCVPTLLFGGHAVNALPQSAGVNVNCRIFPGVPVEEVQAKLVEVMGEPAPSRIEIVGDATASDASPLRDDVMSAVRTAIDRRYPGLEIVPQMSAGATDSLHFRNQGLDSYGVSGIFMKASDEYAHGLNERVPVAALDGALDHWRTILTELSSSE